MEEKTSKDTVIAAAAANVSRAVRHSRSPSPGKKMNWPYLALSLVIGTLLWVGVDFKRMKELTIDIDVAYESHLPADWKFMTPPLRALKRRATRRAA